MAFSDLIPWGRDRNQVSDRRQDDDNPMMSLQRDLNRVFEDFWGRFDNPFGGMTAGGPRTDISETDEAMLVSVDLPGLDENDIEVNVTDDMLTIRGEREDSFPAPARRRKLPRRDHLGGLDLLQQIQLRLNLARVDGAVELGQLEKQPPQPLDLLSGGLNVNRESGQSEDEGQQQPDHGHTPA